MASEGNNTIGHYARWGDGQLTEGFDLMSAKVQYEPHDESVLTMFSSAKQPSETTATAVKHDTGKADLSLNPTVALEQMAQAFMLGEKKYGRYNYYKGMEASRLVAACLRHVAAWNEGEDNDPESGHSHLGHALACLAMMLQQQKLGTLKDNRHKEEHK